MKKRISTVVALALTGAGVVAGGTATSSAATSSTNSTKSSFTFAAAGDFGPTKAGSNPAKNFAAAKAAGVDFFSVMGDLSYSDPAKFSEKQWCDGVKANFSNPVMLVTGNHESGLNPEAGHPNHGLIDNFVKPDCLPNRMKVTTSVVSNTTAPNPANYGREYYYDYGQQAGTSKPLARMIDISAGEYLKNGELWSYKKGDAHYNWVAKAIDDAHAQGIKWVIVTNHTNYVTVGHHGDEVGADLYNMMLDKKVDLFLNGHDHTYQRSKQFAHTASCSTMLSHTVSTGCIVGNGSDGHYTAGKGMVQVITGTGGANFHEAKADDSEWGYMSKVMGNDYQTYGFLKVNVTQDAIKANFVNVNGPFTDAFTIDNKPSGDGSATRDVTFTPSEDTSVDSSAPSVNKGKATTLETDGRPTKRSYLRFKVSGLNGKKVVGAKMRLFVTDPSKSSQNITAGSGTWSEASTTYVNRPGSGATLATLTNTAKGWVDVPLSASSVTQDGTVDFGIHPKSAADTDGLDVASRESANKPQLIVTTN